MVFMRYFMSRRLFYRTEITCFICFSMAGPTREATMIFRRSPTINGKTHTTSAAASPVPVERQNHAVPKAYITAVPRIILPMPYTLYFPEIIPRSGIRPEKFRELMMNIGEMVTDVGSVLDGEKAVEVGLIDSLGGLSDAVCALYAMIEAGKEEAAG